MMLATFHNYSMIVLAMFWPLAQYAILDQAPTIHKHISFYKISCILH